jgi:hypothetical protein
MGMFSYCCNGCGHELHEGEAVRIDGFSGLYDGYGGIGEHISDYNNPPSCWHQACYQKAPYMEKKANKPSAHADNQGFGPGCLEFLPDFDPEASNEYMVHFEIWDEIKGSDILHLCQDSQKFMLLSENDYETEYSRFNQSKESAEWFESLHSMPSMSEEEKTKFYQKRCDYVESKIGMKRPERVAVRFSNLEDSLEAANALLPKCNFYLIVRGIQGKIGGAVYVRKKYGDTDQVEYEIGKPAEKKIK